MTGRNRSKAQSIIETVVGIIFMIPVVLFLFDIGIMVLANTANDNLAKQAARAAASATPPGTPPPDPRDPANHGAYETAGKQAADAIVNNYTAKSKSVYMTNVSLAKIWYDHKPQTGSNPPPGNIDGDPGDGNVSVFTYMECIPPVPFPGFNTKRSFYARAVEPIVALPPS